VGNIGSDNTRSYTVIGDTANLAARLERANRVYGTQILVGETTAQAIGSQFEMREIDTISAKGKTETTRILELMSATGQLSEDLARLREPMSKLGGPTSPRSGIWLRRFSGMSADSSQ
jgi:adenylate cyclase